MIRFRHKIYDLNFSDKNYKPKKQKSVERLAIRDACTKHVCPQCVQSTYADRTCLKGWSGVIQIQTFSRIIAYLHQTQFSKTLFGKILFVKHTEIYEVIHPA